MTRRPDPAALAALHAACFSVPRPWSADAFASLRRDRSVFERHCPCGFAIGRAAASEAELLTLAVTPDARRQGHGRRLVAAFEAEAARRGARTAFLEVAVTNHAARALYTRLGYTVTGRRPGYYADAGGKVDALVMARALPAPL